jgi:prolyl oligopeptidase
LEIGKDFPRIAEVELESSEDGHWIVAAVANGDGGDFAHYLRNASGQWRHITRFEDGIKAVRIGRDGALYLLSRKDAPRGKILRMVLDVAGQGSNTPSSVLSAATVVVPQREGVVEGFAPADHGLYIEDLVGGPSALTYFPPPSTTPIEIPTLPISTVSGLNSWHGDELVFGKLPQAVRMVQLQSGRAVAQADGALHDVARGFRGY